ncbi:MAG: hypothetical protein AAGK32_20700, partial [Actinomycetota bacterium]
MATHPTEFASVLDLARLPWFELRDHSRLVVADDSVGPVIDMHTHLGMGHLRRLRIDLSAATPRTAYYLPMTAPVDLDRYSNNNLDPAALFALKLDLALLGL